MATIEERAKICAENVACDITNTYVVELVIEHELTEQDRIARAEERERCIKAAQDAHCGMCPIYEVCHNLDGGNLGGECNAKENIRKAMEGGE